MSGDAIILVDRLKISLNGTELTPEQAAKVSRFSVESSLYVPDMAIIFLEEIDQGWLESGPWSMGTALTASFSEEDNPQSLTQVFDGEIVAVEPFFANNMTGLNVRAYDKGHRLHRGAKTKAFINTKDSDIASQIAQDAGLTADVDQTTETFDYIAQDSQTDFDFLVSRATRIGYEVLTEGSTLKFKKISAASADFTLTLWDSLVAFYPRTSLSAQVDTVTVRGWDGKQKQPLEGTASSSTSNPQTGMSSGGATAQQKFGAATYLVSRKVVNSQSDATQIAQGLLDKINTNFVEADGEAVGMPGLRAGKTAQLNGLGPTYSGKYRLTTVRHDFNSGDYSIHFTIEGSRPTLISDLVSSPEREHRWTGAYPGVVTNNKSDQDDRGMVKVKFPWLDDTQESAWARLVVPGGGAQRGVYFMPEVNDEVLVVFEQGDFNRPYVLGGLYNSPDAPAGAVGDIIAEGKVKTRLIKTRTGHTVTFLDDSNGEEYIEIKDAKGNTSIKFDATNKKIVMTSQGDIEVTATGNLKLTAQQDISIQTRGDI